MTSLDEGLKVAQLIGYPVLVRPSYVLGGRAMEIVHNATELVRYMSLAMELDTGHPVLIDKYLQGKEVEVDAIAMAKRCSFPGSWSISSAPGCTAATPWRSIPA